MIISQIKSFSCLPISPKSKKIGDKKMRKTSFILVVLAVSLIFSVQLLGQSLHRDIAVVGHNLNHPNNPPLDAINSTFSGWTGPAGNAGFQVFTTNPPQSFLKNKLNGAQFVGCNVATLTIPSTSTTFVAFPFFGIADLVFTAPQSNFNVVCGNTLVGTFSRAVLHVANGSHSASITLFADTVLYGAGTNLINNLPGNFAFGEGSLSIAIITREPVIVTPPAGVTPGSISAFRAYSNITFGARKLP
jgi:hypothetical protein